MSTKLKTVSAIVWAFTDFFILKGFSFFASIVLARLLGPEEFGLVGMISIFIAIGTSLLENGLSSSIIRSKTVNDKDLSTVFYSNICICTLIYAVIFISAPFISEFFKQPVLSVLLRVNCLSFVISSFAAIPTAILVKGLKFKKITLLNIPGSTLGVTVGLILALKNYGIWSIVWMNLATQFVNTCMICYFSSWYPKLIFSFEKLKYHFEFGYKLMLSSIIDTIFNNIYNILIGRIYSVKVLGYYERAFLFNQYPIQAITIVLTKVSYPLLADLQDEKDRIATAYKQMLQIAFLIVAPLMIGAAAIAEPLFLVILGKEWLPAVPYFKVICIASIFYPIHAFNINVLKVCGRSDLFLKLEIVKKAVMCIGIGVGLKFGIYGLLWSGVATSMIALVINSYYSSKMISYSTEKQLIDLVPTIVVSGLMFCLMTFLLQYFNGSSVFFKIGVVSSLGFGFYLIVNHLFKISAFSNFVVLIRNIKSVKSQVEVIK